MSQSFIKGAAILGFATLFCKILGAAYRIPYQNITGNEGMFIYQQVYPLYSTLLAIATAGLPVAISKIVSERLAIEDDLGARKVMKFSMLALFSIGLIFFCLLFFGAGKLAEWMGNRQLLTLPIQTVSFALLLVPIAAAIRGYFQGRQNMLPTAISQSIEQFTRVCTILFLSWYLMDLGLGILYASAGAIFGAVTGAIAAIIVLLVYLLKERRMKSGRLSSPSQPKESYGKMMKKILLLSFPICMGSLVIPLFSLVDAFTVANVLTEKIGSQAAVVYKGVFDRGQPLIQFAAFFATSLSLSIVPAIAEERARKNEQEAKERARLAIRITWLTGLPAAIGLSVIAMPTNIMLFKDDLGSDALAIVALSVIFLTLNMTSTGILQGFGKVYLPAITLLIGAVIKWIGNLVLIPWFGIKGAAIATVVSYAIATLCNFLVLRKIDVSLKSSGFLKKLVIAVSLMTGATYVTMESVQWFLQGLPLRLEMTVTVLCSIAVAVFVFIWGIFRFKVITLTDLEQFPSLKKRIVPILYKWRLLRS